ncbi:MAG: flagellar export protein FliJ [Caldilineaceae bacterium]|nr:flagellar export protein FliJ [Caldilineaceae bacterium]
MPPAFRFQTILDYRKRSESERQMDLAQALQMVVSLRAQRERLQSERLHLTETLKSALLGQLDTGSIEREYRYLAGLDQQLRHLTGDLQQAEQVVTERRGELAQAVKERKTLERLKEYDHQSFVTAWQQKEQDEMDELNITRHASQQ